MVISPQEKAVLLERLQKARETKAAKAAEAKKAKAVKETPASVKEPEPPAPVVAPVAAPPPAPAPEPEPEAPVVAIPEVPDLVAMSRKKPAKKKCIPVSSDEDSDEDEAELPPKKGKAGKKHAYMKIKIYKEPKNAAAFQSLIEAVQEEEPEPEPVAEPPRAPAYIRQPRVYNTHSNIPPESRSYPSKREMMRQAALEFFS